MSWDKSLNIKKSGIWLADKIKLIEKKETMRTNTIYRGGVFNVSLGNNIGFEKNKSRPCLVLSNNTLNKSGIVIVVPLSTKFKFKTENGKKIPIYPTNYILYKSKYSFLSEDSCLKFEDVRSIDSVRLENHLGNITTADLGLLKTKLLNCMGY